MIQIITNLLIAVNVLISILLIFVILLQRPKNEGLGAAFGGDTASNIFGAQTTNVLANITRWLGGSFMVLTLVISVLYSKRDNFKTEGEKSLEAGLATRQAEIAAEKTKTEEEAKAKKDAPPEGATPSVGEVQVEEGKAPEATPTPAPAPGSPGAANPTPAPAPAAPAASTEPAPAPTEPAAPAPAP